MTYTCGLQMRVSNDYFRALPPNFQQELTQVGPCPTDNTTGRGPIIGAINTPVTTICFQPLK